MKNSLKPKCPQCNRQQILYTKRTNAYWCRQCGYEWKKEEGNNLKKELIISKNK